MGKAKKIKVSRFKRNKPLDIQLIEEESVKPTTRVKNRIRAADHEKIIDDRLSKKILDEARKQQEDEHMDQALLQESTSSISVIKYDSDDESNEEDRCENDQECFYEDIKIDEADEKALEKFMNKEPVQKKTLADYIMEKLKEKETEINTQFSDAASVKLRDIDEKVVELYRGVKLVLSRYRSGKIPKAFKLIPALCNWEQILSITEPDKWSSAAMFQATRLFSANLKEKMAQRFFNLVLLPRIRDEIAEYKRLNFHLYQSLRKALFKPPAFFKGIILPLCSERNCSLREAVIISSVMAKSSIPLMHSCAAMLKISEMEYSGANSVFLHTLIRKKYALPYRVVDALVHHFLRFNGVKENLPVLWYHCLLVFVENYKNDMSDEQKEALACLMKVHTHPLMSSVIMSHLTL